MRTDEQGGTGTVRTLGSGGCTILRGHADCGSVPPGDSGSDALIAIAHLSVGTDFQRCFVAGTVGHITAHTYEPDPEPPGSGSWTVTFAFNSLSDIPVATAPYSTNTYADTVITGYEWSGFPVYEILGAWNGIQKEAGVFFERWLEFFDPSGSATADPDVPVSERIRVALHRVTENAYMTVTFYSPYGENAEDVVISWG